MNARVALTTAAFPFKAVVIRCPVVRTPARLATAISDVDAMGSAVTCIPLRDTDDDVARLQHAHVTHALPVDEIFRCRIQVAAEGIAKLPQGIGRGVIQSASARSARWQVDAKQGANATTRRSDAEVYPTLSSLLRGSVTGISKRNRVRAGAPVVCPMTQP